ncbi:MAG: type II toxin-antitoxin system HicA family toxin [Rhodospirillales bacterium]
MSDIDWSRLRSITARHLVSAIRRDGFSEVRQAGSHRLYRHPDGRRVTITFHQPGQTFPPKTLRSMLQVQARWTMDDLKRLRLMR